MVKEIVDLTLPVAINVKELEDLILKELQIPKEDIQIIKKEKGEIKLKVKKNLKKEVLKLIDKHAKYYEELIGIRKIADRYGFLNYFKFY